MGKYAAAFLYATVFAGTAWSGSRALTLDDYYRVATVADPHLSPDGRSVAYVVSRIDQGHSRKSSVIWIAPADASAEPRQITYEANSTHPRWSPDGSMLAFLSSRSAAAEGRAGNQVWTLAMHGGEARRVTKLKNGVNDFEWSPDGRRMVLVAKSGPDSPRDKGDERVYLNPWYKSDGSGFFDDQRPHIWVVDVASGVATQLTKGDARDDNSPRWSPDGTCIVFVARRLDGQYRTNEDVWTVPAAGGEMRRVSDLTSRIAKPAWSHDGRFIAYIASGENEVPKLWVAPATGGKSELAAAAFTYPEEVEWTGDGRAILALAPWRGSSILYRVDLRVYKASPVTKADRWVTAVDINEHAERMTYLAGDATHSADVYCAEANGSGERQLTHLNRELWSEVEMQPMERVEFKGADGWDVEGLLMPPRGRQPGVKYPMILSIHGGPNGMSGMNWSHEFQMYAARGYAVFTANPRGSSGYGEKFQRGVEKEWGGKAYQDIMAGVDEVIRRNSWIDGNRLAVRGQSYGGFMTNWIVSHNDRFRAAATLSGISDFISDEGVRDGFYGHDYDFGGDLLSHFETYWNGSPLKYARNVHTPVLILHGDADMRVPLSQGEEWFRALRFYGKTAEFVVYPREPHSLRVEPKHAVSVTQRQLEWFDRYLNDAASAAR
jgi:dipeptidyl aminopeptidase/acylaminoacyl peptidase